MPHPRSTTLANISDLWDTTERSFKFTWDTSLNQRRVYINGALAASNNNAISTPSITGTNFSVGTVNIDARQCDGTISELTIY